MTELIVALLMIVHGEIKEARIQADNVRLSQRQTYRKTSVKI